MRKGLEVNNTFIFRDDSDVELDIVQEDSTLIIKGPRETLSKVSINELSQPGIYFLLSENFIYVGQSGVNVMNRLNNHLSTRDWWTDFLVITDDKGFLEKTMTEYIEEYFIKKLRSSGFNIDNDTVGNTTPISRFTFAKVNKVIKVSERILKENLQINLLKTQVVSNLKEIPTHSSQKIIDQYGNRFESSTLFGSLVLLLQHYAKDPISYSRLSAEVSDDDTSILLSYSLPEANSVKIADDLYLEKVNKKKAMEYLSYFDPILELNATIVGTKKEAE